MKGHSSFLLIKESRMKSGQRFYDKTQQDKEHQGEEIKAWIGGGGGGERETLLGTALSLPLSLREERRGREKLFFATCINIF